MQEQVEEGGEPVQLWHSSNMIRLSLSGLIAPTSSIAIRKVSGVPTSTCVVHDGVVCMYVCYFTISKPRFYLGALHEPLPVVLLEAVILTTTHLHNMCVVCQQPAVGSDVCCLLLNECSCWRDEHD